MFNIKTTEIFPSLIHLHFDTQYEITSTMMRLQEFYESPHEHIRDNYFNLEDYMDTYAQKMGNFTYTTDWSGFNVPGNIVNKFFKVFDDNLLAKEVVLKTVVEQALKDAGIRSDKYDMYYLIASYDDKEEGKGVLEHEIAHGLYYLNQVYKAEMEDTISSIPSKKHKVLVDGLKSKGYTDHVIADEIQAYFSTSEMLQLCEDFDTELLPWEYVLKCKKIFEKYHEEIEDHQL